MGFVDNLATLVVAAFRGVRRGRGSSRWRWRLTSCREAKLFAMVHNGVCVDLSWQSP